MQEHKWEHISSGRDQYTGDLNETIDRTEIENGWLYRYKREYGGANRNTVTKIVFVPRHFA